MVKLLENTIRHVDIALVNEQHKSVNGSCILRFSCARVNTALLQFPLVDFTPDELESADLSSVLVDHDEFEPG